MADGPALQTGDWVEIGQVADIYDGPHATPSKTTAGPIFLGISNLNRGRLDLSSTEHLSEEDFPRWTKRVVPRAGDIVFSYETRLGEAALIPPGLRCCLGRRMGLLRAKEGVEPRFLLFAYLGPDFQETLKQRTVHGSTVDRIPLVEMPRFPIRVPPLREQRAIAAILSALDDKIELNRQMNETLEEMARALFKSWFVDFDPVHAKAAGKKPFGMDEGTARLFPNKFSDTEASTVPAGWVITTLSEVCADSGGGIQTGPFGSQLHASDYVDDGVPCVMPKDLRGYRISTSDIARVAQADAQRLARHQLKPGDIVYSRRGDVERCALVTDRETGWLCGTGCLLVRFGDDPVLSVYAFHAVTTEHSKEWIVRHAHGATMPNLNTQILGKLPVLLPPEAIRQAFSAMAEPVLRNAADNNSESETLASLRDTLLPKLLSGELRIKDAERIVGEVT